MDVTAVVADNVKKLREHKKLTLDAAAEITGVSRSMLAQIEKGDVNPTISVLWKIAGGFKVSFTSLVENKKADITVLTCKDAIPLIENDGKYENYPVFAFDESKAFETYRIVIKPEGSLNAQPHLIGTEEYITVFAGEVQICTGGKTYLLHEGDSIHFHADMEHSYANAGKTEAHLSMLIYYGRA